MLERPRFKFYLKSDETNWFKVIDNTVISDTTKVPLVFDPVDWAETDISYVRHETYRGVMRSYTAPVTLCEDGAYILRSLFFTKGYNGRAIFESEILDEGNNSQLYVTAYSGEVDFSSVASADQNTFQTAVLDRGLIALIKAGQNVPQPIQLLDADCSNINHDGVKLKNKSTWTMSALMQADMAVDASQFSPALAFVSSEAPFNADIKAVRALDTGTRAMIATNSWFYEASAEGFVDIYFQGQISARLPGTPPITHVDPVLKVVAMVSNNANTILSETVLFQRMYPGNIGQLLEQFMPGVPASPPLNHTIYMMKGERLSFYIGIEPLDSNSDPNRWFWNLTNSLFKLSYSVRVAPTYVRCYRQIDVWRKCLNLITGSTQYGIVSDYLTDPTIQDWGNCPFFTMMTSGDAARGLGDGTDTGAALMKVKLADLFEDLNNRCAVGLGIEGDNIRIEPLSYFFNKNLVSLKLGLVKNFEVTVDKAALANVINIGYQDDTNEALNGKQDPFTTYVYGVPVRYVDKTIDWVSPFVASIYHWEYLRTYVEKATTDTSLDNKILLCEVDPVQDQYGYFSPRRHQAEPGGGISGIDAMETAYNLALMPHYNLRRKSSLVHSTMHLMTEPLAFKKADQNKEVETNLGTGYPTVKASDDLRVEDMDEMIYPPLMIKFKFPAPPEFDSLLFGGRNALIEFDVLNKKMNTIITMRGFLEKASVVQGRNEPSEWLLRPAPDTDLSQMIW